MTVKKDSGQWLVDIRPDGANGKRVRKRFDTKAEALRFEAWIKNKAIKGEWNPKPADKRKLSTLVDLWYKAHGQHLKGGEKRKRDLLNVCTRLNDPIAQLLTPSQYTTGRDQRITNKITPKTCNNELGYLNAVYNELNRTSVIDYPNPLDPVRMIRIPQTELAYLEVDQVKELLEQIKAYNINNPHVYMITKLCLATGARWSEAEGLKPHSLRPNHVTYNDTKSGKNRTIPISAEFYQELSQHLKEHGPFTRHSLSSFRRALAKTSIKLPKGQAAHVLRHSFASHFMMNGGNILTLQRILGHASITMTMRYAHLAPEHLEEAVRLNPLQTGHFVDTEKGEKD